MDLDLIREILLQMESSESVHTDPAPPEGCDWDRCQEHLRLLEEAGFIDIGADTNDGISDCRLTFDGHQYLNAVRDGSVWSKVKKIAAPFGGVPIAVIRDLAVTVIQQRLLGPE